MSRKHGSWLEYCTFDKASRGSRENNNAVWRVSVSASRCYSWDLGRGGWCFLLSYLVLAWGTDSLSHGLTPSEVRIRRNCDDHAFWGYCVHCYEVGLQIHMD